MPYSTTEKNNLIKEFNREKFLMHSDKTFSNDSKQILPDGSEVKLGVERKLINEVLFDPTEMGQDIQSIPDLVMEPLSKVSLHLKKALTENILVIGGTSNTAKFTDRLKSEVEHRLNSVSEVKWHCGANRDKATWVGASFQFIGDNSEQDWIHKIDQDEHGERAVLKGRL